MKTYTDRTTAPLIFHDINRYARLPLTICFQAFNIFGLFIGFTYQWYEYLDLSFAISNFVLLVIAFIGCMKWKPSAWYSLIALSALGIIYNILYLLILATFIQSSDFVKPIAQIIADICIAIYYIKRQPLFFSAIESQLKMNNEQSEASAVTPLAQAEMAIQEPSKNESTDASIYADDDNNYYNDSDFFDDSGFFDEYDSTPDTDMDEPKRENPNQSFVETVPFKLFKRIQFMAEGFCDNTTIFPYGATLKDKEVSYIYVYFLYSHANVHHNYFDKQIFTDALAYIRYTFKEVYNYTDEMLEIMYHTQREKLEIFLTTHAEYIDNGDNQEPNLFGYTESIIKQFPNASFEDAAMVDVIFAEFFYNALEEIQIFKDEISASESNEKDKYPLNSNSNITQTKKFFCKENTNLILCIIALIGSIIGNIYQSNLNQSLTLDVINLQNDYSETIEFKNRYKSSLYDLKNSYSEMIKEYNFYHNYAVIVFENDPYYHTYDCDHVDDNSFWIYNVEAAISEGYQPCPYCNPPQ